MASLKTAAQLDREIAMAAGKQPAALSVSDVSELPEAVREVIAHLRSEVTCPGCLVRLRSDRTACEACRLDSEDVSADPSSTHVCDPMRA